MSRLIGKEANPFNKKKKKNRKMKQLMQGVLNELYTIFVLLIHSGNIWKMHLHASYERCPKVDHREEQVEMLSYFR